MNPPTTPRRRPRSSSRPTGPAPAPPCSHGEPDFSKKRPPGALTAFVALAIGVVVFLAVVIVIAKLAVLGFRWVVA